MVQFIVEKKDVLEFKRKLLVLFYEKITFALFLAKNHRN